MLAFFSRRSVLTGLLVAGLLVAGWWLPGSRERAFGTGVVPENACKVYASGRLSTGDTFFGNVDPVDGKQLNGPATGTWTLVTPLGDEFVGTVTFLSCRRDGGGGPAKPGTTSNIAEIEGAGTWNGAGGYEFVLTAHDHGRWTCGERDVLQDDLAITIVVVNGPVVYTTASLVTEGDIQLLAPGATPSPPCSPPPSLGGVAAYPELPSGPATGLIVGATAGTMAILFALGGLAWRRVAAGRQSL